MKFSPSPSLPSTPFLITNQQQFPKCLITVCMYVCRKMNNSQARTGHQRVMGGRGTDDDDTHERHTDTNKLTRHTASWLPHTLSWRTHNSGPRPPCHPPQHTPVPRVQTKHNNKRSVVSKKKLRYSSGAFILVRALHHRMSPAAYPHAPPLITGGQPTMRLRSSSGASSPRTEVTKPLSRAEVRCAQKC